MLCCDSPPLHHLTLRDTSLKVIYYSQFTYLTFIYFISFRTIVLITIFSQYLKNFKLPFPGYSKEKGLHMTRFALFRLFPVSNAIYGHLCASMGTRTSSNKAWVQSTYKQVPEHVYESITRFVISFACERCV